MSAVKDPVAAACEPPESTNTNTGWVWSRALLIPREGKAPAKSLAERVDAMRDTISELGVPQPRGDFLRAAFEHRKARVVPFTVLCEMNALFGEARRMGDKLRAALRVRPGDDPFDAIQNILACREMAEDECKRLAADAAKYRKRCGELERARDRLRKPATKEPAPKPRPAAKAKARKAGGRK